MAARDFYNYLPMFILFNGFAGGAFDEAREEASICFQFWMKLRKIFMKRLPMVEIIQLHNRMNISKNFSKSLNKKKSKYIQDTRYVMHPLHIDYSMFSLF